MFKTLKDCLLQCWCLPFVGISWSSDWPKQIAVRFPIPLYYRISLYLFIQSWSRVHMIVVVDSYYVESYLYSLPMHVYMYVHIYLFTCRVLGKYLNMLQMYALNINCFHTSHLSECSPDFFHRILQYHFD